MHQCEVWRELLSPLHKLNFALGGAGPQHMLWPLENGEVEHSTTAVVWAGTNNHRHMAEQVAVGTKATVQPVNQQQPQAQVTVPSLLPRGRNLIHFVRKTHG